MGFFINNSLTNGMKFENTQKKDFMKNINLTPFI